MKVIVT